MKIVYQVRLGIRLADSIIEQYFTEDLTAPYCITNQFIIILHVLDLIFTTLRISVVTTIFEYMQRIQGFDRVRM